MRRQNLVELVHPFIQVVHGKVDGLDVSGPWSRELLAQGASEEAKCKLFTSEVAVALVGLSRVAREIAAAEGLGETVREDLVVGVGVRVNVHFLRHGRVRSQGEGG